MKPGLIPTVTTDKNGKITTVHKRPVSSTESLAVIPAPTVTAEPPMGRTALVDVIAATIHETLIFDDDDTEALKEKISAHPDDLLKRLHHLFTSEGPGAYFVAMAIERGARSPLVSETVSFSPYFETDSLESIASMIEGLHHYPQLPKMEDYGTASKEIQEKCIALLAVAELLDDHDYYAGGGTMPIHYVPDNTGRSDGYSVLKGDDLIELVLEQPADAHIIADIIIERATGDAELIREIMSQDDSRALNSGVL